MLKLVINTLINVLFLILDVTYIVNDLHKHRTGYVIGEIVLGAFMLILIIADVVVELAKRKVSELTEESEVF